MKKYTAKTLEDLLKTAALEKNVSVEELTYYVTEEKSGFLGFGGSVTAEVFAEADVKEFVHAYFSNFFSGLDLPVEINVTVSGNSVRVEIDAENNAIIIGKNGRSLEGLNNLARNVVNSQFKRRFYVNVDVNNYKGSRYAKLKDMAKRIAKTVARTKVTASLDPMPNDERRVIHKELTNFPNVRTESEGKGRDRHLKIVYDENKE